MSIYVPNEGELEMLKSLIKSQAIVLGLYKNAVTPTGNEYIGTVTPLTVAGGYAPIPLTNDVVLNALAADKWYIFTDTNGRAAAQYHNAALSWTFDNDNTILGETAYGIYAFTWLLPFKNGTQEIKVGDTIKTAAGAVATVTAVFLTGGTWAGGDAVGTLCIKARNATLFTDSANFYVQGKLTKALTVVAAGTGYDVGDLFTINGANGSGAIGIVLTKGGSGDVLTAAVVQGGHGYTGTLTGLTTTKVAGGGDDALTVTPSLDTTAYAQTNTQTTNAGDAIAKLLFMEPFTAGYVIDTVGQKITYIPKITLASA